MPMNAEQTVLISYVKEQINREDARMNAADNRIHMLDDDYLHLVKNKLEGLISKESWKKMEQYVGITINIFTDIIDQISDIYLDDPVRDFSINGKTEGKKIKEMGEIYDSIKVNQIMGRVNTYINAVNDVFLHPVIRNGKLELDILTPNVVRVITAADNPSEILAILVMRTVQEGDYTFRNDWVVWTKTEHYVLSKDGEVIPIVGNEEMVNPYGILPFVIVHKKKSDGGFWDETSGDDLFQSTILANVKQAFIDFYFVWNSFKQISISTDDVLPSGIIISPDKVLQIPEQATANILDFQLKFEALDKTLDAAMSKVSKRYGIDKESFGGAKELSGRALKIKNQKLEKIRKKQIKIFRDAEKDLLFVIATILNIEGFGDYIKMEVDVLFTEPEVFIEPKEELDIQAREIELNLKSAANVYMARNKNIKTKEEAMEHLKEIIKDNNELKELSDESINNILNDGPEVKGFYNKKEKE